MKLKINGKTFTVKVVEDEDEMSKGLRGVKDLPKEEGMLFKFDEPQDVEFEMDGTLIDIDMIFIDEDNEIISIEHGKAGEEDDYFVESDVKYVLEINPGFKFKPGMEVEFLDDEMHVLDSDGNTQMIIKGGERIFSRKNTRTLVKMAKRAKESDKEVDYKKLGRKIFQYLDIQEDNDPDYVESPKKEKED